MDAWLSYRLEDFLPFSEQVYWRLFALHNTRFWWALAPASAAAAALALIVWKRPAWGGRAAPLLLACAWGVCGWSYFSLSYATINWAGPSIALAFYLEGLLLAAVAASGGLDQRRLGESGRARIAFGLLLYALALHPLVPLVAGRSLAQAELFALAPAPTAIATLACLALARGIWRRLLLLPIPLAGCALSWATLYGLGTSEAWIPASAALVFPLVLLPLRRAA